MEKPLVSLVVASFNHAPFVKECLDAAIAQTYQNWEMNIFDDGSSDGTKELIEEYTKRDPRIKLFTSPFNRGVSPTFNASARLAKGKYCSMMATDDVYLPEKIEKQVAYMEAHPECGACFSHVRIIDENGKRYHHPIQDCVNVENAPRHKLLHKFFMEGNFLASPTEMIRTDVFKEIGYYQNGLILTADYDTHLKVLYNHNIHVLQEPLVNYRFRRDNSNTSAPTGANNFRARNEMELLLNTFLEIKDLDLFTQAFEKEIKGYGKPTQEFIPYFIARLAIDHGYPDWGYRTLCEIIKDDKTYEELNKHYGFTFKEYLSLAPETTKVYERQKKLKKYRKRLRKACGLLILSIAINIILLLT